MTDDQAPAGLPGLTKLPEKKTKTKTTALDAGRHCQTCGREARIHSGPLGVRGYCGHCKTDWAISGPRSKVAYPAPGRGISKQTYVEPDYDQVFEDLDGDDEWKPDE